MLPDCFTPEVQQPEWIPKSVAHLQSPNMSELERMRVGDYVMVLELGNPIGDQAWKIGRVSPADCPLGTCNTSQRLALVFVDELLKTMTNKTIGRECEASLKDIYEGCVHDLTTGPLSHAGKQPRVDGRWNMRRHEVVKLSAGRVFW